MRWTNQHVRQMRELRDMGLSASQIGERMGLSRSAIVSKATAVGLPGFGKRTNARPLMFVRPKRFKAPGGPVSLNISIMELNGHNCHFPHGEGPFTFCGHEAKEGEPYCAYHMRITHEPRKA